MTNKKQPARGFFDEYEQLEKLSKLKDPLEKLSLRIDFESFRATLASTKKPTAKVPPERSRMIMC